MPYILFDARQIKKYNKPRNEVFMSDGKVIIEKQDLTYLRWTHARASSGTAGTFLKSEEKSGGKKYYYKLSNFDIETGVIGHECVNEIIVDRLLDILQVEHLSYQLIHGDIEINGRVFDTWVCRSEDFKTRGETKGALDSYYQLNCDYGQSPYDFCSEQGWQSYIDTMLAVDFLIQNRDRHGANIEVLKNSRAKTIRIAPLFDHGLSLMFSCQNDDEIDAFDISKDRKCHNFVGSSSTLDNLNLIKEKNKVFQGTLVPESKEVIFQDLDNVISAKYIDKIWDMIYSRWCYYESL